MNDKLTISQLFNTYSNDVYNFLVYYQGTKDVQDLVQEVFIKANKGLRSFRNDASPKTWLFSIARNVAIDNARKNSRRFESSAVSLSEHDTGQSIRGPEDVLLDNEWMQELYSAIMALKPSYRDVLILRGIESMSGKETAVILGWKESKVKQTYHRAKKALHKQLILKGALTNEI